MGHRKGGLVPNDLSYGIYAVLVGSDIRGVRICPQVDSSPDLGKNRTPDFREPFLCLQGRVVFKIEAVGTRLPNLKEPQLVNVNRWRWRFDL